MDKIIQLVVLAFIGEAVWETLKMVWQENKFSLDRFGALIIGLLICIGAGFDAMVIIGIPLHIPYLGMILTGILVSRGSNFAHDFISGIGSILKQLRD